MKTDGELVREWSGLTIDGKTMPDKYGYADFQGEVPGEWTDKAIAIVNANDDMFRSKDDASRKDITDMVSSAGLVLAEAIATGEVNEVERIVAQLEWNAGWEIKRTVNHIRDLHQMEKPYPEVEDDYNWWDGEKCEYWGEEPDDVPCTVICEDPDEGGEYDGKAYCTRHLDWMRSEAYECVECGKRVSEPEFHDSIVETGDPDAPYCSKCLKKIVEALET